MQKRLLLLLFFCLPVISMNAQQLTTSSMQTYALRLAPNQDLKAEILKIIDQNHLEAVCVLTCVGSLKKANIRFANQENYTTFEQKFEIVSLVGVLSKAGAHLHISLSDSTGKTIGGHLGDGNIIYTTAEIILGILPDYRFTRELDAASGYKELKIYPKKKND